jgi:plasmid replication initiation protein
MYPEYDTLRVLWVPKTGKYKTIDIDILDERKMARIMDAYLSGEVLDKTFLTAIMEEILDRNLTVSGTKEQLERLVEYMYMSGISYRRI